MAGSSSSSAGDVPREQVEHKPTDLPKPPAPPVGTSPAVTVTESTADPAPDTTDDSAPKERGTTIATEPYTAEFLHPDHPDVKITPLGPVSTEDGSRVELTSEQRQAFTAGAKACRFTLLDIPTE